MTINLNDVTCISVFSHAFSLCVCSKIQTKVLAHRCTVGPPRPHAAVINHREGGYKIDACNLMGPIYVSKMDRACNLRVS